MEGDYILTNSGVRLSLVNPKVTQITISDIAIGLSNECRWMRQLTKKLTVAEHSIIVSRKCPKELKLEGLLHDAAEAYLGDWHPWIKKVYAPQLKELEMKIMTVIFEKFGLNIENLAKVKEYDLKVEEIEFNLCFGRSFVKPIFTTGVHYYRAKDARYFFLKEFERLTNRIYAIPEYLRKI